MKFALFVFILGVGAGACGLYYLQNRSGETGTGKEVQEKKTTLTDRVKEDVKTATDAVGREIEQAGQAVRTKAAEVGESVAGAAGNARIVTTIKAKLALDSELKARAINVDCDNGQVTLTGTVANAGLVSKAVNLALETEGVTKVHSQLAVTAEKH